MIGPRARVNSPEVVALVPCVSHLGRKDSDSVKDGCLATQDG
jgi:hypothetical protein